MPTGRARQRAIGARAVPGRPRRDCQPPFLGRW